MNYTVEKEDGAFASPTTVVENVILGDDYTYFIENAALRATYTITVLAVNQLGWSGSTITVNTCKHRYYSSLSMMKGGSTGSCILCVYVLEDTLRMLILFTPLQLTIHSSHLFSQCTKSLATKHDVLIASPLVL